jgi:tRNA nucleotidyltransferase/poly(A) polymerase
MNPPADGQALLDAIRARFPELGQLPRDVLIVGGAIRDVGLGRDPLDIDLAAADAAAAAQSFASATRGILVQLGGDRFTTYRVVVDGRIYDFNAMVGGSIEEDALRRDFTVNAVALDPVSARVIDPTGGLQDLQRRLVRMVREENFADDPVRIIKAIRIAVVLDFTIDRQTLDAMRRHTRGLDDVAAERIGYELNVIFSAEERARGLILLDELGLDQQLFGFSFTPELTEAIALAGGRDPVVAYAILFFERGEEAVNDFAARWRWSERLRKESLSAMQMARSIGTSTHADLPILIYDFGLEASRRAVQLLHALGEDRRGDDLAAIIGSRGESIASTRPLVSGDWIQAEMGMRPGPDLGRLKRAVLEAQLRGEVSSTVQASELIRKLAKGSSL